MSTSSHEPNNAVSVKEEKDGKGWTRTAVADASDRSSSSSSSPGCLEGSDEARIKHAKLTRKIDLHIVPPVAIIYMFCFLDRANVGNARLAGMERDLGMSGSDYNILLTAFYVAYIVFELPSNLLCKVFGPGKW